MQPSVSRPYSVAIRPILWIILCLLGCSFNAFTTPPPTVLFLGDSLTAGYTLNIDHAFPAQIQARMGTQNIHVINGGVSGDTTYTLLNRLPMALANRPQMVFLCIGANDGLRGTPAKYIYSNIDRIIQEIKKNGIDVALAGMSLPQNYTKPVITQFEAVFSQLAQKHDLDFMPFLLKDVAGVPTLNLSDRIHPNQKGHQIIAKNTINFLYTTPLFSTKDVTPNTPKEFLEKPPHRGSK